MYIQSQCILRHIKNTQNWRGDLKWEFSQNLKNLP